MPGIIDASQALRDSDVVVVGSLARRADRTVMKINRVLVDKHHELGGRGDNQIDVEPCQIFHYGFGMYFLRRTKNGRYRLIDSDGAPVPALLRGPPPIRNGTEKDIVINELAAILDAPEPELADPHAGLATIMVGGSAQIPAGADGDFIQSHANPDFSDSLRLEYGYSMVISDLASFDLRSARSILERAYDQAHTPQRRLWIAMMLLRAGDTTHGTEVSAAFAGVNLDRPFLVSSVGSVLAHRTEDDRYEPQSEAVLSTLLPLQRSLNVRVRRAYAEALEQFSEKHSGEDNFAIRPLLFSLFNDLDPQVRNLSLQGICASTQSCDEEIRLPELNDASAQKRFQSQVERWLLSRKH